MLTGRSLTTQEVAAELRIHPLTVQRWLREGKLRGTKLPGKAGWRIASSEVERMLSGEAQPVPAASEARAVAVAEALHRAGLARARGDDEAANRFEAIAGGMAERDRVD